MRKSRKGHLTAHHDYDVAPDGRFLMIQEPQASTPLGINVVLNSCHRGKTCNHFINDNFWGELSGYLSIYYAFY